MTTDEKTTRILYTASATSTGDGRNGHVRSTDGFLDQEVRTPKELGGPGGATNPEQLFAAGYSACFHSALKGAAKQLGLAIADSAVTAEVGIGPTGGGAYGLAVTLVVELDGVTQEEGERLTERAHELCPYSNATRGNIEVVLQTAVV